MQKAFKYFIVGNSVGAVAAIEALREVDKDGSVGLVSSEPGPPYCRPLISYFLAGEMPEEQLTFRPLSFYESNGVEAFLGLKAEGLDLQSKTLHLQDGSALSWEKLLLATGGAPIVPPLKGLEAKGIFTFTALEDARGIKERLPQVSRAVVLGGGLIGLKAAEALAKRGVKAQVIELADRILSPALDATASCLVSSALEKRGIEIILGHTIKEVMSNQKSQEVEGVLLDDGRHLPCQMLIVAIGVKPNVELVKESPLKTKRGIIVDKHMRTSHPDVFACGDVAESYDFILNDFRPLPLWPNAYTGGRCAGFTMAGHPTEHTWATNMNSVDFFDYCAISAGFIEAPSPENGFETLSRVDEDKGHYRKLILKGSRVVGMLMAGEVDRAGIFLGLMRDKVDISSFKDKLLSSNFGLIYLPREVREAKFKVTGNR